MRQIVTRISDELHEKLKRKAAADGTSVNALVTEVLTDAVAETERDRYFRQMEREGRRVIPPQPENPPSHDELRESLPPGAGDAVLEAIIQERRRR